MGSQALSHPDAGTFRGAIPIDINASSTTEESAEHAQAFSAVIDEASDSNESGLGCARGIRLMIGLEAATALCLYGIWHLWHVLR